MGKYHLKLNGEWRWLSRYVCFVRARGYCEHCGVAHGTMAADGESLIRLECAHLNGDTKDLRLANLRALCTQCHRIFDQFGRVEALLGRYPEYDERRATRRLKDSG